VATVVIKDGSSGPYPGRTWAAEAEAKERRRGAPFLFGYVVERAARPGACGTCGVTVDGAWHFCSRHCFVAWERVLRSEARAEARG
jgi:hypothetical protein